MTTQAETVTKTKQTSAVKEPGMYKVTFFNDNVTPMDFVVQVLMEIFKHNHATNTPKRTRCCRYLHF